MEVVKILMQTFLLLFPMKFYPSPAQRARKSSILFLANCGLNVLWLLVIFVSFISGAEYQHP
jgi:hypothetical protein